MTKLDKPNVTLFHCINSIDEKLTKSYIHKRNINVKLISLPCSSLVKDVYLLRAFEAGADAVAVLVCPENQCRHLQGSIRARKRVERTKKILEEIGLDQERLSVINVSITDQLAVSKILQEIVAGLSDLGPIRVAA